MNLQDLRNIDFQNIDFENIGAWPPIIKVFVLVIAFAVVCALSYFLDVQAQLQQLTQEEQQQQKLLAELKTKAFQAKNLEEYKQQMIEMEQTLGTLLRQLPSDTEVPGLLDDISRTGLGSGLEFESIKLLPEKSIEFYAELPIEIKVRGGYHEFGSFVSGVSSLPRIVTLHDLSIIPIKESPGLLALTITAKTYRYNAEKQ